MIVVEIASGPNQTKSQRQNVRIRLKISDIVPETAKPINRTKSPPRFLNDDEVIICLRSVSMTAGTRRQKNPAYTK